MSWPVPVSYTHLDVYKRQLLGDVEQMFFDLLIADAAEIKALAARENSHRQLMRRCGGEDKNHMSRRLLQGFEDSIESVIGQHMHFVDDIDLIAFLGRSVFDPLAQITDQMCIRDSS